MAFLRTLFHREREPAPLCSAVIVAAGRASRMEGIDKILTPMGGQPLLLYTLAPFQACEQVGEIVIVTREDLMVPIGTLCSQHGLTKVRRVVKGGESRTESVLAGLGETDPQAALVAIHDGARPFLPEAVLEEAIQAAAQHGVRLRGLSEYYMARPELCRPNTVVAGYSALREDDIPAVAAALAGAWCSFL